MIVYLKNKVHISATIYYYCVFNGFVVYKSSKGHLFSASCAVQPAPLNYSNSWQYLFWSSENKISEMDFDTIG